MSRATTLRRSFYNRPTLEVAHDLIGKVLVHRGPRATTSGMIVEVEAYIGESDPACHAAPGPTERNAPLYGPPGYAYVYLNYGIHYLVNAVTEAAGTPAAVLIRALEPLDGITVMRRRRTEGRRGGPGTSGRSGRREIADHDLCRGPGNLTLAMGVTLKENRLDLCGRQLFVEDRGIVPGSVIWGPRIGISVGIDRPWRAHASDHPAVSAARR